MKIKTYKKINKRIWLIRSGDSENKVVYSIKNLVKTEETIVNTNKAIMFIKNKANV